MLFINLSLQGLNGVLNNTPGGFRQMEDRIKALEKESNYFQLKLAEKVRCSCRLFVSLRKQTAMKPNSSPS
jgi:hypothetical protein